MNKNKENLTFSNTQNSLERYHSILINSKLLNIHAREEQYINLLRRLKEEIAQLNTLT